MPQPYLLQEHSHSTQVPPAIWSQWYTEERNRDMVHFGICKTAAFYRATSDTLGMQTSGPFAFIKNSAMMRFGTATSGEEGGGEAYLAWYQTDRRRCLECPEYEIHVRQTNELWDAESICHDVGSFEIADLELVEVHDVYGPREEGEGTAAPHIIHCKLEKSQVSVVISEASQLDGYRRSLVYKLASSEQSLASAGREGESVVADDAVAPSDLWSVVCEYSTRDLGARLDEVMESVRREARTAALVGDL
ncbi:hypothetical protein BAUCODRAFT_148210 [Baudoinia panamericana UAMH 10762]|uniref:Uncharacterized protein n=1 Tax=Baudoinia panamericana (strain UAMH 10762) TaxID=717646 RepID=M2NBU5_BAUPA|nr:uncharacterized protein BAUCODRAFT_148210 [Baudoinia panamericana UAMH 10762]EMC96629.1 hypothetical protein BAUCODRAFT_148210 [Baudoinia panamericana UAMH 10762]